MLSEVSPTYIELKMRYIHIIIKKIKLFSLNKKKFFFFVHSAIKIRTIISIFKFRIKDPSNSEIGKKIIKKTFTLVKLKDLKDLMNSMILYQFLLSRYVCKVKL